MGMKKTYPPGHPGHESTGDKIMLGAGAVLLVVFGCMSLAYIVLSVGRAFGVL